MCSFNPVIPVLLVPIVVALPPARMLPAAPCHQPCDSKNPGEMMLLRAGLGWGLWRIIIFGG
jgi:hypothetical protein